MDSSERSPSPGHATLSFRFGRVPYGTYGDMSRDHQNLLDFLSNRMGLDIGLQLFANYGDMVAAIQEGKLELAWLGPLAYLEAEDSLKGRGDLRVVPIVKPMRRGLSQYSSEIIVRVDANIDTLSDLAGRRLACVDTESTAGYLLAAAHLIGSGISVTDPLLARRNFLNQYGNVVLAVLFGKFDAGAVYEGAVSVFLKGEDEARRKELKVLARTDPIPNEPIAAIVGGKMSEAQAAQFQRAFMDLNGHPDILKKLQVAGFVETRESEYRPIRRIVEIVNRIPMENPGHVKTP